MSEPASVPFERLLLLAALLGDGEPQPIEALAARLGVSRETVLRDVSALTTRPADDDVAGFVDAVTMMNTGETLTVCSTHFQRPARLGPVELAAAELGLALVAQESPPAAQPTIAAAREQVAALASSLSREMRLAALREATLGQVPEPAVLATIRVAMERRRCVRLAYRKADAAAAEAREVAPYALLYVSGGIYVAAETPEGLRLFRLDRVEGASLLERSFTVPDGFRAEALVTAGRAFTSEGPLPELVVRFSPRVARWIAEREGRAPDADGSLTVRWPLGDETWAVHHLLQYGPEVTVLEPASVRAALRARLTTLAARLPPVDAPAAPPG
jgi:proteasome accessory factor C